MKPNLELKARFGDARTEYVVDKEPVRGVSVKVRVYGKLDIGPGLPPGDEGLEGDGVRVAAGKVVNFRPVDNPTNEETGE